MASAITWFHTLPSYAQAAVGGVIVGGPFALWLKFVLWLIPNHRISGKDE